MGRVCLGQNWGQKYPRTFKPRLKQGFEAQLSLKISLELLRLNLNFACQRLGLDLGAPLAASVDESSTSAHHLWLGIVIKALLSSRAKKSTDRVKILRNRKTSNPTRQPCY